MCQREKTLYLKQLDSVLLQLPLTVGGLLTVFEVAVWPNLATEHPTTTF